MTDIRKCPHCSLAFATEERLIDHVQLHYGDVQNKEDHAKAVEVPIASQLRKEVTDNTTIPFGKYQGMALKDVPKDYLYFLFNEHWFQAKFPDLYDYCEQALEDYDSEPDYVDEFEND